MAKKAAKSKKMNRCRICNKPCSRKYCSPKHRQKYYRIRKARKKARKKAIENAPFIVEIIRHGYVIDVNRSYMIPLPGNVTEYAFCDGFSVRIKYK